MKPSPRGRATLCLLTVVAVAGCSDDDDAQMLVNAVDPVQAVAAVGVTFNEVVVPLVALGRALRIAAPPRGCDEAVSCPDGGSVQRCGATYDFMQCNAGALIDGSIADDGTGAVTFDLLIDGAGLSGTGSIGPESCASEADGIRILLDPLTAQLDGTTAGANGNLIFCSTYPDGVLTVTIPGIQIFLEFVGTSTVSATATDLSTGDTVVHCTGDLGRSPVEPTCN